MSVIYFNEGTLSHRVDYPSASIGLLDIRLREFLCSQN